MTQDNTPGHLIEPKTERAIPTDRQLARQRTRELSRRKQAVIARHPDRFTSDSKAEDSAFTEDELLEIYGPPTAKQIKCLYGLGYTGNIPKTTKQAAQLISMRLKNRST